MARRRKSVTEEVSNTAENEPVTPPTEPSSAPNEEPNRPPMPSWPEFLRKATDAEARVRYASDLNTLCSNLSSVANRYKVLLLLQPEDSISAFSLDQVYAALS